MKANAKLLKLLETATHPTASAGERLNALDAFRRISDRAGGLDAVLSDLFDAKSIKIELGIVQEKLVDSVALIALLEGERDELLRVLASFRSGARGDDHSNKSAMVDEDRRTIEAALSKDWQELHHIHEKAKQGGFTKPSKVTQECLQELVSQRVAATRESGTFRDRFGTTRWQPQGWRLKPRWQGVF